MLSTIGNLSIPMRKRLSVDIILQALLLFETCQTFDLELEHIWIRGRVSMILLFVSIRHLQLASLILNAIELAFVSPNVSIIAI